jgi:hypothetical protein
MPGSTPGVLRDTKLTDFFQRRSSRLGSGEISSSPLQPSIRGPSLSTLDSNVSPIPTEAKPKRGRPKGSGRSKKAQPVHGVSVSSSQSPFPGGSGPAPGPAPLRLSNSNSPVKRRSGRTKGTMKKAVEHSQDVYTLHPPRRAGLRATRDIILPLNTERSSVLSSPLSSSPPTSTPSKRKFDDDDDAASLTSSRVPLSLYYMPRQPSSQARSKPQRAQSPVRRPSSSNIANKRRRRSPPRSPHTPRHPVTPRRSRRNEEVVPTSQPNEVGLYSPTRPDPPRRKKAVHESVENWRHGRSAYRFENVPPLRFSPAGDYSMEIDRPLSPLTSCSPSLTLGSPLSSFSDLDTTFPEVEPIMLPPLSQQTLPSPAPSSPDRPSLVQSATPTLVPPVTPPPSSPEQEQPTPVPVAPKDSKMKTAEILKEIWENVRAKSASDSEESCLYAPISELSSEEEDEEPFWKSDKTLPR